MSYVHNSTIIKSCQSVDIDIMARYVMRVFEVEGLSILDSMKRLSELTLHFPSAMLLVPLQMQGAW
jgi:hypothetical protein